MKKLLVIIFILCFCACPLLAESNSAERVLVQPVSHVEPPKAIDWLSDITIFGEIDIRAGMTQSWLETKGLAGELVSDLFVYGAGMGLEVGINPYFRGSIYFILEEEFGGDDLGLVLHEGFLTFNYKGLFAEVGRRYLPVGQFDSYAVNDSLVYTMAETRQTTLGLGYRHDYFEVSGWAFNGAQANIGGDGTDDDDTIDGFAFRADVFPLAFQDRFSLALGGYFLSDATETSLELGKRLNVLDPDRAGWQPPADNPNAVYEDPDPDNDYQPYKEDVFLYGGYLSAEFPFIEMFGLGLVFEYVSTGPFAKAEYRDDAGSNSGIWAINAELAALIWNSRVQFGPKLELISGIDWLETGENDPAYEVNQYQIWGFFANFRPWQDLLLGLQFDHGWDNEQNTQVRTFVRTVFEF